MIIFSIPIYAMSSNELDKKYKGKVNAIHRESSNLSQEIIGQCMFPQKVWKYNHIIGYIEISAKLCDVYFNVYLPHKRKNYCWQSKQKVFVTLEGPDISHFTVFDNDSNDEIIHKIYERIAEIKKHLFQRYYIDLTCFDNIAPYLDLRSLLLCVRENQD